MIYLMAFLCVISWIIGAVMGYQVGIEPNYYNNYDTYDWDDNYKDSDV